MAHPDTAATAPTLPMTDDDRRHLRRCVDLATRALDQGHAPFGTVVVLDGTEVFADHNRCGDGDRTQHPEFAAARWAATHLTPEERAAATVYTSGEHCAMCAAAHGWVGLGRIVYAANGAQLAAWMEEFGAAPAPVATLAVTDVVPGIEVAGPAPEFADELRALHERNVRRAATQQARADLSGA